MMREIIFRGLDVKIGGWWHGYYWKSVNGQRHHIRNGVGADYEVTPATIGQYIGLKDKTGKMIFEGDWVQHGGKGYKSIYTIKYDMALSTRTSESRLGFWGYGENCIATLTTEFVENCEIIGNIHEDGS